MSYPPGVRAVRPSGAKTRYTTGFAFGAVPAMRVPSLRRHKPSGQGVVTLSGHDHYLGPWPERLRKPPPEVRAAYDRLLAEWVAGGRRSLVRAEGRPRLTVSELILAFWKHAELHYRHPDGTPTNELNDWRLSLRPLRELYGATPA